ncbi:MAG TPA: MATE family efflux transporter [Thermoanaerobaculia bacterium]|nr:MATE family efflux transporter [Thermoanaerobaculia bacterium]
MNDLTQGSVHRHLSRLAGVILFGMVFQTLYYLVDLYFVAKVSSEAVAAVSLSGNLMLVTVALTQALTIGTTSLVAHAWGRKDYGEARRIFNQSQVLATGVGLLFVTAAFALRERFAAGLAADEVTARAVRDYLDWFLPAMGVQFLLVAMAAALRGAGEVKAPMMVQMVAVLMNTILAPVLIVGWGTGRPLGVAGAGLATFLSICAGALLLVLWVRKRHDVLHFEPHHWWPDWALWRRMLGIGLPTGGEFLLMSVYATMIYGLIRGFGSHAQAGFGVGMRVLQTGFMPALAVGFAVAPLAGQNFGAGHFDRVRQSFKAGLLWASVIMLTFMALCHISPIAMIRPFAEDPEVIAVGTEMLGILSFNFLAAGVVFVASALFQAMGNTIPSLIASGSRLLLFAVPAMVVSQRPGFALRQLWWLSVGSVLVQMVLALWLLRREMRIKEDGLAAARNEAFSRSA